MAEFKLLVGHNKKSYQREIKDADAEALVGLKIGDTFKGEQVGMEGYEFLITGGSDSCGFPMRKDLPGIRRAKIYSAKGKGIKSKTKGMILRKSVAGNTIYDKTAQVNVKVLKEGKEKLEKEEAPKTE